MELRQFKCELLDTTKERIAAGVEASQRAAEVRYKDPDKYFQILNDWYAEETSRRFTNLQIAEKNPDKQKDIVALVSMREHIADWICDWIFTADPRNSALGLPVMIPWVLWPRQVEAIEWIYTLYLNQKRGMMEKSRDMGATFLFCAVMLHEWQFSENFGGGIGSNKFESVDTKDNPKSVFSKLRSVLYSQPTWMMPKGFCGVNDKVGNLVNPANGSNIAGEGGDNIGRGDRRSMYLVDEAAFLENPAAADQALSQTTNSQFDLSTPNGRNHYGQKRFAGKTPVFTFNWRDDPRKNQEWHDVQVAELDSVIVAQEIDISYDSSVEGLFIDPKHIQAAINFPAPIFGTKAAGLDVAAGGKNKSSLARRHGIRATVVTWNYDNGVDLTYKAIDECNSSGMEYLNYDKIGVGHAVHSTITRTERPMNFRAYAVDSGDAASDNYYPEFQCTGKEIFRNMRTEMWYSVARRFEKTYEHVKGVRQYPLEELISIENNGTLIAQLASPKKFRLDNGKIALESKEAMAKRGVESPDEADALVMAFVARAGGVKRVWPTIEDLLKEQEADPGKLRGYRIGFENLDIDSTLFCSQYVDDAYQSFILLGMWNRRKHKLYIFDELTLNNSRPEIVITSLCQMLRVVSNDFVRNLKNFEWFGNDIMFNDRAGEGDLKSAYGKYYKAGAIIRRNAAYNEAGAIGIIERLIFRKGLIIHARCADLPSQMALWFIEGNGPAKNFGLCRALCNFASSLYETGRMQPVKVEPKPYSKERTAYNKEIDNLARSGDFVAIERRQMGKNNKGKSGWMI